MSTTKVFADNLSNFFSSKTSRVLTAPLRALSLPSSSEKGELVARSSSNELATKGSVLPAPKPAPVLITINVSGRKFLIDAKKLKKYPTTLLGSADIKKYYDPVHKEYFFDRNRDTFESIFDFYLFGKLYPPQGVPEDMYLEEVAFYRMMSVFQHPDENSDCDFIITPKRTGSKFSRAVRAVNKALQDPSSSIPGKIWGWLDIFFIALSVVAMVTETNPEVKRKVSVKWSLEYNIAFAVETVTVFFFSFDVLIRFTVSDERWVFARSPATWLDIVTVAPYYFELFVDASRFKGLKVLRMARVVRVLKLIKKNKRLLLIAYVMSHSLGELSLLIIVWAMCITVAGSVFYYCENEANDKITSGVDAMWWAVVTMSTVGYGDIVPVTFIGKAFSTVFFYIGMVFLALPLTIIVGAFTKQYENRGTWSLNRNDNKINKLYENSSNAKSE